MTEEAMRAYLLEDYLEEAREHVARIMQSAIERGTSAHTYRLHSPHECLNFYMDPEAEPVPDPYEEGEMMIPPREITIEELIEKYGVGIDE